MITLSSLFSLSLPVSFSSSRLLPTTCCLSKHFGYSPSPSRDAQNRGGACSFFLREAKRKGERAFAFLSIVIIRKALPDTTIWVCNARFPAVRIRLCYGVSEVARRKQSCSKAEVNKSISLSFPDHCTLVFSSNPAKWSAWTVSNKSHDHPVTI